MQDPILIIGASGTIGSAIATKLTDDGCSVILHGATDSKRLKNLASKLKSPMISGDISDQLVTQKCAEKVHKCTENLSGLIFAAAMPFPHKLTLRTEWQIFQQQLDSQLKPFHLIMQHFKTALENREDGARVIVLSTEYLLGTPPIKIAPYLSAKAALTTYAKVLSQELLSSKIRVHIIAPGLIKSPLTGDMPDEYLELLAERMPEKKLTTPEEVANLCAFMMQPDADALYGNIVPISRGSRR